MFFLLADGFLSVFCGHFSITHLESNENMAFFLARTIGPPHIEAQTAQNKKKVEENSSREDDLAPPMMSRKSAGRLGFWVVFFLIWNSWWKHQIKPKKVGLE